MGADNKPFCRFFYLAGFSHEETKINKTAALPLREIVHCEYGHAFSALHSYAPASSLLS
jgi:hypothetical protein